MNDAPEPTPPSPAPAFNLDDLRLLPDWMKADAPAPPGAARRFEEYEDRGDRGGRGDRDRGGDFRRPPRPGGGSGGGGFRPGGGAGGPRPGGGAGGSGPRDGARRDDRGPRPGGASSGGPRDRRDDRRGGPPPRRFEERPAPLRPAPVRVDFLPDPRPLAGIAKEIRSRHLAYPLFGLARMFLERPESHRIRLAAEAPPAKEGEKPGAPPALFQLGEDGPIALARAALENLAFDRYREQFYVEQSVQKDPPKGNFVAVARERGSGVLLGPPNHHSYQTNLRALYDSRYSRRMDFEEYRRGVEIVNDPALVERWKEEVRTVTTYTVRDTMPPAPPEAEKAEPPADGPVPTNPEGTEPSAEANPAPAVETAAVPEPAPEPETVTPPPEPSAEEAPAAPAADAPKPVVFENLADVRNHFRQTYLDSILRSGTRLEMPGPSGRQLSEGALTLSLRLAHEQELRYPAGLVQPLRVGLQNAGLHIFKHRKRVVYASAIRPTPFRNGGEMGGAVSEGITAILETIGAHAMISGKDLAAGVIARRLGPEAPAPAAELETAVAPAPEAPAPAPAPANPRQEAAERFKAHLAADLRYLIGAGHVIAFHNGTFDLPLPPRPKEAPRPAPSGARGAAPVSPVTPAVTGAGPAPAEAAPTAAPAEEEFADDPEVEPSAVTEPGEPDVESVVELSPAPAPPDVDPKPDAPMPEPAP